MPSIRKGDIAEKSTTLGDIVRKRLRLGGERGTTPTTFNISQDAHNALRDITKKEGKGMAGTFEMLLDIYDEVEKKGFADKILSKIDYKKKTKRATYHIYEQTLRKLNKLTKRLKEDKELKNIDRNSIIDSLVLSFKHEEIVDANIRRKQYRSLIENIINPFHKQAYNIHKTLIKELGDDPIVKQWEDDVLNEIIHFSNIMEFLSDREME